MEQELKAFAENLFCKVHNVLLVDEQSAEMRDLCYCCSKFKKNSKSMGEKNPRYTSKQLFTDLFADYQSSLKNVSDQDNADMKGKILSLFEEHKKTLDLNVKILQSMVDITYLEEEIGEIVKTNNLIEDSMKKLNDS